MGFNEQLTNIQGSYYWRAENLDGRIVNPDVINWTGIDITDLTDLTFSGYFGARTTAPFESSDYVRFEADTGAGFTTLIKFRGDDSITEPSVKGHMREDTDDDGDGALLTGELQEVSDVSIPGTGTSLALRLTARLNGGSEEFAFDHFTVHGVEAATPEIEPLGQWS